MYRDATHPSELLKLKVPSTTYIHQKAASDTTFSGTPVWLQLYKVRSLRGGKNVPEPDKELFPLARIEYWETGVGATQRIVGVRHCPVVSLQVKTCHCKTKGLDGSLPCPPHLKTKRCHSNKKLECTGSPIAPLGSCVVLSFLDTNIHSWASCEPTGGILIMKELKCFAWGSRGFFFLK